MTAIGYEINFDCLVGTTHNYAGLSLGNLASMDNAGTISNPKAAALEGLEKMKLIADLGIKQAVLPPHERPHIPSLKALGYTGSDRNIPGKVYKDSPEILYQYCSAAPMWAANAATITPSIDAVKNRVHITPANKASQTHRSIEAETTSRILKEIFPGVFFHHHPPLPYSNLFLDEGAANHIRFCNNLTERGIHLFIHGISALEDPESGPKTYPARQTLEAHQAIARSHQLNPDQVIFAQQAADSIDQGVFHNDLISMGCHDLFFYHELAFEDPDLTVSLLQEKFSEICGSELKLIEVKNEQIPLKTAVKTYLFNSQLFRLPDRGYVLFAPRECQTNQIVFRYLDQLIQDPDSPLADIHFVNLNQSMRNGGGPACLRLPAVLTQTELEAVHSKVFLTDRLYTRLAEWIHTHYREELKPEDLADPKLVDESQEALNALTQILDIGKIYDFQR
jgi:succinylarginine dihydrolase